MEISNAKNKIAEFLQKNRLPLPKYTSERVGGADHSPLWLSTVELHDGRKFKGEIRNTKTLAEISSAEKALKSIKDETQTEKVSRFETPRETDLETCEVPKKSKTVVLVDFENLPNFIKQGEKILMKHTVYVFVGELHELADAPLPSWVKKVVVPSTRANAADSCIQMYIGMFLVKEEYEEYIIATRDRFGSNLVDLITSSNLLWKAKAARQVSTPSKI